MSEQLVAGAHQWVTAAVAVVFGVLTVLAVARAPRAGRAGWWVAAMFASFAVYLGGTRLTSTLDGEAALWAARLGLAVLLTFPYLVLRFAAAFRSVPHWLEVTAAVTWAGVVLTTTVLPAGGPGASGWIVAYLGVVLVYWLVLSLVASVRLWQAGRGQPTVARRRMRLMSAATTVLAAALLLSGVTGGESAVARVVVLLVVLASGLMFATGFAPPRPLVLAWRQVEDKRLRQMVLEVLRADTAEEVAAALLPPVTALVGGSTAALVGTDRTVLAVHGDAVAVGTVLEPDQLDGRGTSVRQVVPLGEPHGYLVVWASRYTPFFAREETEVLRTMGAFAVLALERCDLLQEERGRRAIVQEARREAERARDEADRANRAKSEFLSRMSHELRTPLNAVLGFGQLLELSRLTAEDRDAVGHILKAGNHLLALINDVLDLARIEAGMLTFSLEPVPLEELVQDAVALIRPLAEERSIRVLPDGGACDEFVRTDRQRCRQILLNLLSNAVKYNRDGGEVRVACEPVAGGMLRVSVTDTGPGIDHERRHRLFEPFDRLGAEASGIEGTGLGLALTRQLVETMDGAIGVRTAPGEGSTFWVDLPVTEAPQGALEREPVPAPEALPSGGRTLLLVEDNLTNLHLVEAMLRRRRDVSVLPAMQGQIGLDLAQQHRPDVIVLDLHLPDLSGREILHRLRADPATRDIPVIIASADAMPGRIRQLREDGAFDYLTKPLDVHRFLEVVDAALAGARPTAAVPHRP